MFGMERAPRRIRAALVGTVAGGLLALAAPALANAVTVSPLPGTPDAMPATQISILGTPISNISSVTVTGGESGVHGGHLEAYESSSGASYVLDSPLQEGEEVEAVIALHEGGTIEDRFTVAHLAPPEKLLVGGEEKPEYLEHFKTEPGLRPPKVQVNTADPSLEGDFFLDPLPSPVIHVGAKLLEFEPVGPNGLMLLNPEGKLLWWHQLPTGEVGTNLEKITYEGKTAIAWWQGSVTETAFGLGEGVIANTHYEPIAYVKAGNGQQADIHELYVNGAQAWVDSYETVCQPVCDESHVPVVDAAVQEIDIHTGLVMWEWNALGHIAESEAEVEPANGVFDPFHINSIQPLPGDRVLISLRDTSGVYLLNQDTGEILWQLAGKKSSFARGKGTQFYFQHDARLEGKKQNRLTLFDDEAGPPIHGRPRGLILHLDTAAKKVSLMHQYVDNSATFVPAEGSMQTMPGGDAVVGFGASPYFAEFSKGGEKEKRGKLLFDAQLPKGDGTYRVFRFPWEGAPNTLPKLVAERTSPTEVSLYASWNGATQVASWRVLEGESAESLTAAGSFPWTGFETAMTVTSTDSVFEVQALDKGGHVLAASGPVTAP